MTDDNTSVGTTSRHISRLLERTDPTVSIIWAFMLKDELKHRGTRAPEKFVVPETYTLSRNYSLIQDAFRYFTQGKKISLIAEILQLSSSTIYKYRYIWVKEGHPNPTVSTTKMTTPKGRKRVPRYQRAFTYFNNGSSPLYVAYRLNLSPATAQVYQSYWRNGGIPKSSPP